MTRAKVLTAEYQEPYHDPSNPLRMDRHEGKCHICQSVKPVTYCVVCEHWLCKTCRALWRERGTAAAKQLVHNVLVALWLKHEHGPCCGPKEVADAAQG